MNRSFASAEKFPYSTVLPELGSDASPANYLDKYLIRSLYPDGKKLLITTTKLIGDHKTERPFILLRPHRTNRPSKDLIELTIPGLPMSFGLQVSKAGNLFYTIYDNTKPTAERKAQRPKWTSTNLLHDDAEITKISLQHLLANANVKDVLVSGPADTENLVVMTKSDSQAIATSSIGDLLGYIFKPMLDERNQGIYGNVELIIRKKI